MVDHGNESSSQDERSVADGVVVRAATTFTENKDVEQERATLAKTESRNVAYLKAAVFMVLAIAYAVTSSLVYTYMKEDQMDNFEEAFTADAIKLLESFQKAGTRYIESLDALSVAITSHALSSKSVFPNVTLPDFGVRAANTRALSGSFMIYYHPLVTDATRNGWEAYMQDNMELYNDDYELEATLRQKQNVKFNLTEQEVEVHPCYNQEINRINGSNGALDAAEGSGPYLPLWQLSPLSQYQFLLNFDFSSHLPFAETYWETVRSQQAVLGPVIEVVTGGVDDMTSLLSATLAWSQYRADTTVYVNEPTSTAAYPVFDSFDIDQRKVVGVIGTSLYWRLSFKDVLPKDSKGVYCILENTKGQVFTYLIGDTVTYLGPGDLHETAFSDMEKNFTHLELTDNYLETASFTSVQANEEFCDYSIRIYPSQKMKKEHVNNQPFGAFLVVTGVFFFTSMVFVSYTTAVAWRQRVVMDRAIASGAIVSSLFPSQVRDQLYQENEAAKTTTTAATSPFRRESNDNRETMGRPMASVYESTTIMFADMVGFTAWSAKRTPVQVFELLETLYQAFDAIAVRRKVFKVETIGDCYVAVAGLPEPQENHAVIMAKFADDCMTKMGQLTTELADSLGPDTATLAMRVGLHSGSVTGGVLRGQKSRFQLFGDTMNTASRMESNGVPHKIHVSQETADELTTKGKASWITPREDKIVAKGKGELQTYWVSIRVGTGSSLTSSDGKRSRESLPGAQDGKNIDENDTFEI